MKTFLKIVVGFIALAILVNLCNPKEPTSPPTSGTTESSSITPSAEELRKKEEAAQVETTLSSLTPIKRQQYSRWIQELSETYSEENALAIIASTQKVLAEENITVSDYEMLEAAMLIAAEHKKKFRLEEVLASYATIRHAGKPHNKAISGVKAVFSKLTEAQ